MRGGAVAMAQCVEELEGTVVRVVRTSSSYADRRSEARIDSEVTCTVEAASGTRHDGILADISVSGASVAGVTGFAPGDRGVLRLRSVGADARAGFEVRAVGHDGNLHV